MSQVKGCPLPLSFHLEWPQPLNPYRRSLPAFHELFEQQHQILTHEFFYRVVTGENGNHDERDPDLHDSSLR